MHRLALLFFLVWSCAASAADFFFIQATDPQFGMYSENKDFAQETANFESLIATANRLRPAFVVVTGDLVNTTGDPAQIAEYLRIASKLDKAIPLYNVAGNHDLGNQPTAESLALYRSRFGPDYYTFRVRDMAAFVLDSALLTDEQESWLRAGLEKAKKDRVRHLIVFMHHPLFVNNPEEADEYFNVPKVRRQRLISLFQQYGVKYVFTGHYHKNGVARAGPLEVVITGPVGKPLGKDPSGFRIVIVRSKRIEHQYYALDARIPHVP